MSTTQNLHRSQLIVIHVARKVHTVYMFLECFEACQVSEPTTDV